MSHDEVAGVDPRMVDDPRINHDDYDDYDDLDVRRVTGALHAREPAILHEPDAFEGICISRARRATVAIRTLAASGIDR
jgi:hypothetical protein